MNEIILIKLKLKTFTEQDALDYCLLNNTNHLNIFQLWLSNNELTDISGIRLFKNLKELYLSNNKLTDISVLKDLNKLKTLNLSYNNKIKDISNLKNLNNLQYLCIQYLKLELDQIKYIQSLKNLEKLYCENGFKDMKVIKQLNKNIKVIK